MGNRRIRNRRGSHALGLAALICCWITQITPAQERAEKAGESAAKATSAAETAPAESAPIATAPAESETEAAPPPASSAAAASSPVFFETQVRPILALHCYKCHGSAMRSGGLRLDDRTLALKGGDTGRPVLGGTLENNELWARVSSTDRSYRMPKNAPALSDVEIDVLRRWVAQGAVWPESMGSGVPSFYNRWFNSIATVADQYQQELAYVRWYAYGFTGLLCVLFAIGRCQAAYRRQRAWTQRRLAPLARAANGIHSREMLLVLLLGASGLALAFARGHTLKVDAELARHVKERIRSEDPWLHTIYGSPPQPPRLNQAKHVAGTYYRGNCERNPELFNGGNYLTATFHVSLCDRQHAPLEVGQPLPAGGVMVRLEIERAPGTTDLLFASSMIDSVLLTRGYHESPDKKLVEPPTRLETLKPDWRWAAYVPVGEPDASGALAGTIYLYIGQVTDNVVSGTIHYGIRYELMFVDGKLSDVSDLWMNSFGNGAFANPEPAGKLPYREWFDNHPLPIMEGQNSKDPKLLGVDQYIREGVIEAPPVEPAKDEPGKPPEPGAAQPER